MLTLEKLQQARGQFDDDTILKAIEKRDPEFGERIRKGREHGFDSATMVQAIEKRLSSLPQQQQQQLPQSEPTRAPSGPGLRLLEYAGIPGQLTRYAFKGKKPEAVSFAKEQFQQGKSAEEVTKALRSQDWTENDVNDIMSEIFPHQVPDTGVSKLKPKDIDIDKLSDVQLLELTKEQTTKLPVSKRLELVKRMSAAREQEKNAALIGGATFGATNKLRQEYGLEQPEYIGEGAKQLMTLAGAAGPFGAASKAFKLSEKGLFSIKSILGHTALGEIDLTARSLIERGELPKLEEYTGMLADVVAFEGLLKGGEKAFFKKNISKIAKQQGISELEALQQVVDQSGINPKTNPQKFTEAVEERAKISKSGEKAWKDYLNKKRTQGELTPSEQPSAKKTKKAEVKAYKEQKKQESQKPTLPEKETADLQATQKEKLLKRIEEEKAKVAASKAAREKREGVPLDSKMPHALSGSKPRYGYKNKNFELNFANDVDRALYIASQKTPSKRDASFVSFLKEVFPNLSVDEIRSVGSKLRNDIKKRAAVSEDAVLDIADWKTKEVLHGKKPEVSTTVPTEKTAVASEKPEHRPGEKLELAELRVSQLEKIIKENPRADTAKEQLKQANGNLKEIQEKKTKQDKLKDWTERVVQNEIRNLKEELRNVKPGSDAEKYLRNQLRDLGAEENPPIVSEKTPIQEKKPPETSKHVEHLTDSEASRLYEKAKETEKKVIEKELGKDAYEKFSKLGDEGRFSFWEKHTLSEKGTETLENLPYDTSDLRRRVQDSKETSTSYNLGNTKSESVINVLSDVRNELINHQNPGNKSKVKRAVDFLVEQGHSPKEIAEEIKNLLKRDLSGSDAEFVLKDLFEKREVKPKIEHKQAKIEPETPKQADIKPKKTQKENQASMKKWMDDQWEKKVAKDKLKEDVTHENIESLKKEYAKPEEIAFKPDLMQFKRIDEASEGLSHVDEITGDWDTRKAGVITVWEPQNPSEFGLDKKQPYIVVNGHHRLSKAKKSGAENLRIQVLSEADGITAAEARAIGAEINIADGKGTIYDQVKFLREQRKAYSENEALGRAKQTGSKGREATSIAFEATDNTYSAFVDERITPQQTAAIAEAAPKNESLQALGLKLALKGKKPQEIKNFVEVAKSAKHKPNVKQGDLFSFDDSAIKSMEALADKVTELQTEVNQRIQSASGAVKRPEKAGNMGVKVENIVETKAKTTKLKELKQRLDKIGTDKELMDAVKDGVTVDELLANDKPQDLAFGLGHFNKWLQDKFAMSPTEKKGWNLLHRFHGPRWQSEYTSKVKWNLNLKEQFPDPKVREDMIYYREKTGNPFHGKGDTITDVKKRLSPEAKKFVDTEVDQHLDDALQEFNNTPYVKNINPRAFVQDIYIPHFYEASAAQAKKAYEGVSKRFSTKNPFASKRSFLTYNEALQKQGLIPKFRDIGELMESYDTLLAKIKTSQMVAGELNALQKQSKQTFIVRPGSQKYDAAKAAGWIPFEDPYLRRKYRGLDAEGKQIWTTAEGPALVDPELAQALAGVFVREFKRPPLSFLQSTMRNTIAAVQSLDNLVKYWRVTGSLFHVNSLLEGFGAASGQNVIPGMALAKSIKAFKEMGKRMRDPKLMAEPLEAGLKVEPPTEATTKGFPLIDKWMKQMELKGGAAKKLATAMRIGGTPVRKFNNFLFGQFHPRLKTAMYFSYKQRALDMYAKEGRVLSDPQMKHLNREIAKMVNNQMGGQRWETIRTLNDPTTRGYLEAGIAYPDWTISALREVQDALSTGMRGKLARGYISRYVSQLFMSAQIFNYGFTGLKRNSAGNIEWDADKARFTWQNDDPKKQGLFNIQLPDIDFKIPGIGDINFGKDSKGRDLYFHQGKKLFEIGKYFTEPVEEVFAKSRPIIQWAWGQAAGYSPSGFPIRGGYGSGQFAPWGGTKPHTLGRIKERALHTAEFAVPFAFGSLATEGPKEAAKRVVSSGGGAVPISKGISLHDATDYFEKYYRKNDNDGLIALKRVLLRQGYSKKDIERRMSQAKSRAKK